MIHKEIEEKVEEALEMLFKNDSFLLDENVHERSIAHKLACYLQDLFSGWHVDCEYNRIGEYPSKTKEMEGKRIYPDIVIHKRGETENLLAIELKKNKDRCSQKDIERLKYLTNKTDKYRYQLGLFIQFNNAYKPTMKWFENGKQLKNCLMTNHTKA